MPIKTQNFRTTGRERQIKHAWPRRHKLHLYDARRGLGNVRRPDEGEKGEIGLRRHTRFRDHPPEERTLEIHSHICKCCTYQCHVRARM